MADALKKAGQQAEREAFELALASKPHARLWNTTDAMFWAWQARAALEQQDAHALTMESAGWQAIECPNCGDMARAWNKPPAVIATSEGPAT